MAVPFKTTAGTTAAYFTGLIIAAYWLAAGGPRNWAVTIPDAAHTYGIRTHRGVDLFFRPPVGWFIEYGFWLFLAAAGTIVVEVVARYLAPAPPEP